MCDAQTQDEKRAGWRREVRTLLYCFESYTLLSQLQQRSTPGQAQQLVPWTRLRVTLAEFSTQCHPYDTCSGKLVDPCRSLSLWLRANLGLQGPAAFFFLQCRVTTVWQQFLETSFLVLSRARRRKEQRYPELVGPGSPARLVVLVVEVGGQVVSRDAHVCGSVGEGQSPAGTTSPAEEG